MFLFTVLSRLTKLGVESGVDFVTMKWEKPNITNGHIGHYYVAVREKVTGYTVNITLQFNKASLVYRVDGLKPNTKYIAEVRAMNTLEYGPPVSRMFTTKEGGKYILSL